MTSKITETKRNGRLKQQPRRQPRADRGFLRAQGLLKITQMTVANQCEP